MQKKVLALKIFTGNLTLTPHFNSQNCYFVTVGDCLKNLKFSYFSEVFSKSLCGNLKIML